jgi:hypothetical protein
MQLLELTKLHPLLTLPQNPVAWVRSASLQPLENLLVLVPVPVLELVLLLN